jgi:hypothetical protein
MNNNKRTFDETMGLPEDEELQGLRNISRKTNMPYKSTPDRHGIAVSNGETINAVTTKVVSPDVPTHCLSRPIVVSSADAIDMTMDITANHMRMMVRDCVKKELFRRLKFYKKEFHGNYDFRQGSVCALVIQCCNLEHEKATLQWWNTMQRVIVRTHTDHRNNVIKTIRVRFCGT